MTAPAGRPVRYFKRYSAYKDSGVEWLGEIPAHWEVKPLKAVSRLQTGLTLGKKYEDRGLATRPYLRVANVQDGFLALEDIAEVELPLEDAPRYELQSGDVLLTEGGDFDKLGRGYVWQDEIPHCLHQNHIFAVRPRRHTLSSRFLSLVMSSGYGRAYFTATSKQSTNLASTNSTKLRNLPLPLPALAEQAEIVKSIDVETTRIDALVAKKERLIELLQEKRTALITRAVTKGLDPNVPMKDSGVEWLGEIPAHWDVQRLRHISRGLAVGVVVNPSNYVADEGMPFLYGSDISEGRVHAESARRITPEDSRRLPKSQLCADDLVMVRVGAPGVAAVVPPELDGANCASLLVIRRRHGVVSSWLCYALNSRYVRSQVEVVQYGAAQEQFNVSHAKDFVVAVPPASEQRTIAAFLDRETAKLDALVAKVRDAIDRLRELRAALITAAVTGRIDVRSDAARPHL